MTHKEIVQRNIGLTFDFVNYLHDNPSELDKLPDNFMLEFKEKDFPEVEPRHRIMAPAKKMEKKYVRVRNTFALNE
ncbi:MAG: hypothetical protein LBT94_10240 [Prevotellaceae bacterium]|jgi:hypothetical protein|nr:hypothetical protein [Prevotellaceae bacterium]